MRQQLLAALDFPRSRVLTLIEEHGCSGAQFGAYDEQCGRCNINRQCHWLTLLNEDTGFADRAAYTVNASLRYGVQLIGDMSREASHDPAYCSCEACEWLRGAERLIAEFEETLPANPFRPTH
ncbi:MAG: hypothetical protein P8172_16070 [Gammaproteobacteria bacterium]|jgi:hypothetical protein